MAKGRRQFPPCSKTYGFPLYCAACVPTNRIPSTSPDTDASSAGDQLFLALGGGGGEGRSGVPNAIVVSAFDFESGSLSDSPVCRLGTDGEVVYRMAVHPGGDGIVCSFPTNCRLVEDFDSDEDIEGRGCFANTNI